MVASSKSGNKKKVTSKNKKKGWKKVDISALEDALADERLQERTGGIASEKTDETLFFIDTDQVETKQVARQDEDKVKAKLRKHERKNRPLRCFSGLQPDPIIKPARVPHNIRIRPQLSAKDIRRLAGKGPTATEVEAKKQSEESKLKKEKNRVNKWKRNVDFDLWAEKPAESDEEDEHYRRVTKKKRVNVPSYYLRKASSLPSVDLPHPGQSYNPTYEDHQDLLRSAHEVELKKEKELKRLYNALDAKFPSKDQAPTQETWLEEMSAGLHADPSHDDEVPIPADELDNLSVNPPVRREDLKTRKQRRKDRENKIKAKKLARLKEEKLKKNEWNRLKSIKKEIKRQENEFEDRAKRKAELLEKNKNKTKKLGKYKYEEPDLDLKLGEELKGSLRLLKPEGYLIKDQFHNLQKRNVIETRVKAKKQKRRRPKKFEKKTHKEIVV